MESPSSLNPHDLIPVEPPAQSHHVYLQVRVSRKSMLLSAEKVMETYASHRAVLELEYFGEVGTGLGPTLEFYTLLSHELQRKGLGMWRSDTGKDSEAAAAQGITLQLQAQSFGIPQASVPHAASFTVSEQLAMVFQNNTLVTHLYLFVERCCHRILSCSIQHMLLIPVLVPASVPMLVTIPVSANMCHYSMFLGSACHSWWSQCLSDFRYSQEACSGCGHQGQQPGPAPCSCPAVRHCPGWSAAAVCHGTSRAVPCSPALASAGKQQGAEPFQAAGAGNG